MRTYEQSLAVKETLTLGEETIMRNYKTILALSMLVASCVTSGSNRQAPPSQAGTDRPAVHTSDPVISPAIPQKTGGSALNEKLMEDTWLCFAREDHVGVIQNSQELVRLFGDVAMLLQEERLNGKQGAPPVGAVDDRTREAIFANGPLNDVATAWFLAGQGHQALGNVAMARDAYHAARQLPHGRCWDPEGWFWSPAEAAGERLAEL